VKDGSSAWRQARREEWEGERDGEEREYGRKESDLARLVFTRGVTTTAGVLNSGIEHALKECEERYGCAGDSLRELTATSLECV
jgi:hypothetical protein